MTYQVLARRLRPQRFADVVGQDHVTRTLQAAIAAGRVAHAFLFTGPRGVGKTTTARLLAKALNCERGPTPEPCNACSNCKEIGEGSAFDVLEIDGASHTQVDKMRDLMETVAHLPLKSRFKVFIIDEVHMLSSHSFNALLKTLEEPPPHVKFIFATTEPHKVLATVVSRCQRYDLRRIGLGERRARADGRAPGGGGGCARRAGWTPLGRRPATLLPSPPRGGRGAGGTRAQRRPEAGPRDVRGAARDPAAAAPPGRHPPPPGGLRRRKPRRLRRCGARERPAGARGGPRRPVGPVPGARAGGEAGRALHDALERHAARSRR